MMLVQEMLEASPARLDLSVSALPTRWRACIGSLAHVPRTGPVARASSPAVYCKLAGA
jgi:hypothetical protein